MLRRNFLALMMLLVTAVSGAAMPFAAEAKSTAPAHAAAVANYNAGVAALSAGLNEEAINDFIRALQLDDGLAAAHGPLGQLLYLRGDYMNAAHELMAATVAEPSNAAYWCQLGVSASHVGMRDVAAIAFNHYLALDPNGSYSAEAHRSLALLEGTAAGGAANYVHEFRSVAHRWTQKTLAVYVPAGVAGDAKMIVAAALAQWSELSGGRLEFVMTNDARTAQIEFAWTNNVADMDSADELGTTALRLDGTGAIEHAKITLLTGCPARRASAVVLHEIGHALGLQHSTTEGDIMAATVAPMGLEAGPTERDRNTLLALYP